MDTRFGGKNEQEVRVGGGGKRFVVACSPVFAATLVLGVSSSPYYIPRRRC